jgi:hypothetical protein
VKIGSEEGSGSRLVILFFPLRVKTAVSRVFVLTGVHVGFWLGVVFRENERCGVDEVHNVQDGPEKLCINGRQK